MACVGMLVGTLEGWPEGWPVGCDAVVHAAETDERKRENTQSLNKQYLSRRAGGHASGLSGGLPRRLA